MVTQVLHSAGLISSCLIYTTIDVLRSILLGSSEVSYVCDPELRSCTVRLQRAPMYPPLIIERR